jgi:hypothetical protein
MNVSPYNFWPFTNVGNPFTQWPFTNGPSVITTPSNQKIFTNGPHRFIFHAEDNKPRRYFQSAQGKDIEKDEHERIDDINENVDQVGGNGVLQVINTSDGTPISTVNVGDNQFNQIGGGGAQITHTSGGQQYNQVSTNGERSRRSPGPGPRWGRNQFNNAGGWGGNQFNNAGGVGGNQFNNAGGGGGNQFNNAGGGGGNQFNNAGQGNQFNNAGNGNQFNNAGGGHGGNQFNNAGNSFGGNQFNNAWGRKKRSAQSGNFDYY